jgi:hypothetical protein
MENRRRKRGRSSAWILGIASLAAAVVLVLPSRTNAIPAFARKYNVSCFTCHTIFPHLNKLGYTFRRLGYRMPPDWEGTKPPQKISSLDENIPFKLTNAMAVFARSNVTWDKAPNDQGQNKTTSSINLAEASLFAGGSVPHSNLSYFGEYVMYEDGGSDLERFKVDWTGGNVENSYFVGIGKAHLQTGYAASSSMGLTDDDSPLGFTAASPNGFTFDQSTGMVEGGYTYMAPNYKYIVGLTLKVTNGVDASGEGITSGSQYNHKDVWFGGDFLFGDNGSVSAMYYNGRKPQLQNADTPDAFLYQPKATRWGLFGHYMFFDHLDVLAGYEGGREDWKGLSTDPMTTFSSHAYFGEADYYIQQGLVAYARYDRTHFDQPEPGLSSMNGRLWMAGVMKTITQKGNAKVFAQYTDDHEGDLSGIQADEKVAMLGVDLGW